MLPPLQKMIVQYIFIIYVKVNLILLFYTRYEQSVKCRIEYDLDHDPELDHEGYF